MGVAPTLSGALRFVMSLPRASEEKPMWLTGMLAGMLAAGGGNFVVERCAPMWRVEFTTVPDLFDGETMRFDTCGATEHGFNDPQGEQEIARLWLEPEGEGARLTLTDSRRKVTARGVVAIGARSRIASADGTLIAAVSISNAATPLASVMTVDIVDQPLDEIVQRLQAASGWQMQGVDALGKQRLTLKFDSIPLRSVLLLAAQAGGVHVDTQRDGVAVFRRAEAR
jgi:hypothetical protein